MLELSKTISDNTFGAILNIETITTRGIEKMKVGISGERGGWFLGRFYNNVSATHTRHSGYVFI